MTPRDRYLRSKYGITEAKYNKMHEEQDHSCKICKRHQDNFKNRLAVDHDHKTKEVRGLLCFYCNKRVVGRHNKESVKKLVVYILPEYSLIKRRK